MESGGRKLRANPREKANFLSLLFFGWTIPLFKQTYGKILDASDVCKPLTEEQSHVLGDRLNRWMKYKKYTKKESKHIWHRNWNLNIRIHSKWRDECKTKSNPSLLRAIGKAFWTDYVLLGFCTVLFDVVTPISFPFLLKELLEYFRYVLFIKRLWSILKSNIQWLMGVWNFIGKILMCLKMMHWSMVLGFFWCQS